MEKQKEIRVASHKRGRKSKKELKILRELKQKKEEEEKKEMEKEIGRIREVQELEMLKKKILVENRRRSSLRLSILHNESEIKHL